MNGGANERARPADVGVVGSPSLLLTVNHPDDGEPFAEVGYTTDAFYPTVLVQNVRTESWDQFEWRCAVRVALAILAAASSATAAGPYAIVNEIESSVGAFAPEVASRLVQVGTQLEMSARRHSRRKV